MDSTNNKKTEKTVMIMVANLGMGGQEKMAILLAETLSAFCNVIFVVFSDWNGAKYEAPKNVEYVNIDIPTRDGAYNKTINVVRRMKLIHMIKQQKNIDICVSFGESSNLINCLTGNRKSRIASIRQSRIVYNGPTIIDRITMRNSQKIVFNSYGQQAEYRRYFSKYSDKMQVIYNAVDTDSILKLSHMDIDIDINKWTLVSMGRLVKGKHFANLINSIEIVKKAFPDIRLLIIGEGEEKETLEEQITAKHLEGTVYLLGAKNNPYAYISKARCFVYASSSEGFPNAVLEAVACGVPVISTDCKFGPREILSDDKEYGKISGYHIMEYGILTASINDSAANKEKIEETVADAIIYLLNNPDLEARIREAASKRRYMFSTGSYADNWRNVMF